MPPMRAAPDRRKLVTAGAPSEPDTSERYKYTARALLHCTLHCTVRLRKIMHSTCLLRVEERKQRESEEEECAEANIEQLRVAVLPGDLTQERTDAVVSPSNEMLVLSGRVSQTLVHKGGRAIEDECANLTGALLYSSAGLRTVCPTILHD